MKYLIILLSSLCLCDTSIAAEAEGAEKEGGAGRRVSGASDLSEGARAALAGLDLDGDESAKRFEEARAELEKMEDENKKAATARKAQLKTELIALRDHVAGKDGKMTLSKTLAGIVQEVTDLEGDASVSKLQAGTVRNLNKFKSKLTEEDQEKVDAAFAKLSAE